jgi:hypothetical protein
MSEAQKQIEYALDYCDNILELKKALEELDINVEDCFVRADILLALEDIEANAEALKKYYMQIEK